MLIYLTLICYYLFFPLQLLSVLILLLLPPKQSVCTVEPGKIHVGTFQVLLIEVFVRFLLSCQTITNKHRKDISKIYFICASVYLSCLDYGESLFEKLLAANFLRCFIPFRAKLLWSEWNVMHYERECAEEK